MSAPSNPPSPKPKSSSVLNGEEILTGTGISPEGLIKLVKQLKKERVFGLARKLLDQHANEAGVTQHANASYRLEFAQQRSICTYKDSELAPAERLESALKILDEADPLTSSCNQETLGQAGAIYKNKWRLTGSEAHLETSLVYYLRGCQQDIKEDIGYTAINAAFLSDLLADARSANTYKVASLDKLPAEFRAEADKLRGKIVEVLLSLWNKPDKQVKLAKNWWFFVTLGEAYFGLRDYAGAGEWLKKAAALTGADKAADWEWETTARQLATLLRLQQKADSENEQPPNDHGRQVLQDFLGGSYPAVTSVIQGKIGLALSGGGFRASLYHIGVLARLAELDLLRQVEYLSCVSGGSIVGAHYYLEVRHLLQTKCDADIIQADYIEIVERVADDFLAGVQRNIRTRVAAEWSTNLKMIFFPNYSRTKRGGELYESEIFARIHDCPCQKYAKHDQCEKCSKCGKCNKRSKLWLNQLYIRPKGDEDFVPKDNNWRRSNKIPILILNATTLNTGHSWQFTASWMGEPPAGADQEIDANYRLRRAYYSDLPPPHQHLRLGYAVAASAAVPDIFEPLSLSNLYTTEKDQPRIIRLVDGGVHDNQGVGALLEQSCDVLLVSDASGQMEAQDNPGSGLLAVPLRASSILSARVRSAQIQDLYVRRESGLLRGFMFTHLKQGLGAGTVDWLGCQEPTPSVPPRPLLPYGIQRQVQRQLAAIRTDLDSFSEVEAFALMTSGYSMAEYLLNQRALLGFTLPPVPAVNRWKFLEIKPFMADPSPDSPLLRQLKVSNSLVFKVWRLYRPLQILAAGLGIVLTLDLIWLAYVHWTKILYSLTAGALLMTVVSVLLGGVGWKWFARIIEYRKTFQTVLIGIGMGTIGWFFARLHLWVFDRLFLYFGTLKRLQKK